MNYEEVMVVTISEVAAQKAKEILTAEGKADWGLRIYSAGGGCCGPSYGMDIDQRNFGMLSMPYVLWPFHYPFGHEAR